VVHPPGGRSSERPARPGPRAENKWCTASLVRSPEQVIADAFDQAQAPKHLRPWLVLVDGARHQLDLITAESIRRGVTLHVLLDFVHVAEYVRAAAHTFHKPGTTEDKEWAAGHLTAITGQVFDYVTERGMSPTLSVEGDAASDELGFMLRAQRAGDVLLSRVFFAKFEGWSDTVHDCVPTTGWRVLCEDPGVKPLPARGNAVGAKIHARIADRRRDTGPAGAAAPADGGGRTGMVDRRHGVLPGP
jgi:hypothetical protein